MSITKPEMKPTFNHESLDVYQIALHFTAKVEKWIQDWDNKHAITDHLPRAIGGAVENIAMASSATGKQKAKNLDYALGSTLECASCLDIADLKGLLDGPTVIESKSELFKLFKMTVGLRTAWSVKEVHEDSAQYGTPITSSQKEILFHHEQLDVYRIAIEAFGLFIKSKATDELPNKMFRQLDALFTSMVLNIAEGNGRYSELDQQRFLGTSHESTVKAAAKLDLAVIQGVLQVEEVEKWKELLGRVAAMTGKMSGRG